MTEKVTETFTCPVCKKEFETKFALMGHKNRLQHNSKGSKTKNKKSIGASLTDAILVLEAKRDHFDEIIKILRKLNGIILMK